MKTLRKNVATMKEVVLSGCLIEEELDAKAATATEDDGAYVVEDLTKIETPSIDITSERRRGCVSMEKKDPDTSRELW